MIRCVAVDDESPALDLVEDNIRRIPFLKLVRRCRNAFEAAEALREEQVDLLFLDIQMPVLLGTHFLESLSVKPMVIFITAYRKYALEGFDLDVLDYLVKPVSFTRFLKAANKALEYHTFRKGSTAGTDYFFVHSEYSLVKVPVNEITHVEGLKNYVRIHFAGGVKPILTRQSLKSIEERLGPGKYARVHKSFIVMLGKVTAIHSDSLSIGPVELPVGKAYKAALAVSLSLKLK